MTIKLFTSLALVTLLSIQEASAQEMRQDTLTQQIRSAEQSLQGMIIDPIKDKKLFNHLDAALTVGTPGIGVDFAMPIGDYVQARAGFAFMPAFHYPMTFNLTVEQQANAQSDDNIITGSRFDRMADLMEQLTGQRINQDVEMIGKPNYYNFKLLFDFYPWKDKKWFATAGFYWGNERIAVADNSYDDFSTLFSVNMFNKLQDKTADAYADLVNFNNKVALLEYQGAITELPDDIAKRVNNFGRVGFRLGDSFVTPDENNRVRAEAHTNAFKPYLGIGWGNSAIRGDRKWGVCVELGCMFWGGNPKVYADEEYYHQVSYQEYFSKQPIYVQDPTRMEIAEIIAGDKWSTLTVNVPDKRRVDLCEKNVKGHVGDYIDLAKKFKVFPVLNVRIAHRIF